MILSETEMELIQMKVNGLSDADIATVRERSVLTIRTQFTEIRKKMQVHSMVHAVAEAFRNGWIK